MTVPYIALLDRVTLSRGAQYWLLQLAGWSGYGFFVVAGAWLMSPLDTPRILYYVAATLLGLLLSMAMREYFLRIWEQPPARRLLLSLACVAIASALWAGWKFQVNLAMMEKAKHVENLLAEYVFWYSYSLFILLSWAGLYYGIRYYRMAQEEKARNLQISALAHQAQLKMLRYQLNPHFLFNTLNSISTLILDGDSSSANRMVTQLSSFLRSSLDRDPTQKVTLEQEVEAMRLYLDIEKTRFEDRLRVEFDFDEQSMQALIPSMLLQPIIENSIKYAVARSETGGTIRLAARAFAGELLIEVSDDGPGIELAGETQPEFNGVGLANIRERLQVLYGSNHGCRFENVEPHGLKIGIRIPLETAETAPAWKN
jgi:two-component system LytT family sensor kinase